MGPPPTNGLPFPDHASLYRAISGTKFVSPPAAYPSYSNTGVALLGMALVAANRAASKNPAHEPADYAQLIQRDLFDAMGMNSSHFLATDDNKHLVVTPSLAPEVAVSITDVKASFSLPHFRIVGPRLPGCDESSRRAIFLARRYRHGGGDIAEPEPP